MHWLRRLTPRAVNGLGAAACAGLMGYALYVQHVMGLVPCPLCVFQRIAVIALGLIFLAATVHGPRGWGARVYGVLALIAGGAGVGVAGWHVYLQGLPPDKVPACGPGLDYLLETFPLTQALQKVFAGSGECADIAWSFLGVSMPGWVLLWCLGLGVGGLLNNLRRAPGPPAGDHAGPALGKEQHA